MKEGRKALFFDIDGTLLSVADRKVPESAKQAFEQAHKNGHLLFINSGRTFCLTGSVKEQVKAHGFCCGCGTYIIAEDQILLSAVIPHEQGIKIKHIIQEYNLDGVLEGTESCIFRKGSSRFSKLEAMKENVAQEGGLSIYGWEEDCYDFDKFCVFADEKSDLKGFFRALGLDFKVINLGGGLYECVPFQYSKATAIELVIKHYGISLKDTYVFGDSANDLSMFEYAKNCILMGRHSVELEPYATFYTKNVEDDGLAYAMKKLGLV